MNFNKEQTALSFAICEKNELIVRLLLENSKIDVNQKINIFIFVILNNILLYLFHVTPLHLAFYFKQPDIIELLLLHRNINELPPGFKD